MTSLSHRPAKRGLKAVFVAAVLGSASLALGACTETTYQHKKQTVGMSKEIPLQKVTAAIQDAGRATNWTTRVVRPGLIEARREWGGGKHNIVIDVVYTSKSYEFKYKSSKNLGYTGGSIHRSYRIQLDKFDAAIKARTWNL